MCSLPIPQISYKSFIYDVYPPQRFQLSCSQTDEKQTNKTVSAATRGEEWNQIIKEAAFGTKFMMMRVIELT